MRILRLPYRLSVAKYRALPEGLSGFFSLTAAEGEISLVAETASLPHGYYAREDGWRVLGVEGPLDFSLVGILREISSVLAECNIPIFALSTYDTDYVMVREDRWADATAALLAKGYEIV